METEKYTQKSFIELLSLLDYYPALKNVAK